MDGVADAITVIYGLPVIAITARATATVTAVNASVISDISMFDIVASVHCEGVSGNINAIILDNEYAKVNETAVSRIRAYRENQMFCVKIKVPTPSMMLATIEKGINGIVFIAASFLLVKGKTYRKGALLPST